MNKKEIEKLAYELKNEEMSELQKSIKTSKLAAALLELSFVDNDANVEVATAFNSAFSRYGQTIDSATNEAVPFLQLFAHDYNLKKPDVIKAHKEEEYGVNQSLRRQRILEAIRYIQEVHGIRRLDVNINVLNLANVKELLNSINATHEEIAWVESLNNEMTVVADCESRNENTDSKTIRPSDPISLGSYENAERTFDTITDGIESLVSGIEKKKDRKYATWYVTLKSRNYESRYGFGVEMDKYIDKDLLKFCEKNGEAKEVDILTKYTGLKRDSVRKSWKTAEKLFTEGKFGRKRKPADTENSMSAG